MFVTPRRHKHAKSDVVISISLIKMSVTIRELILPLLYFYYSTFINFTILTFKIGTLRIF